VSANTFTLIKTHALRIGPDSGRIAVTGNSFCDSYIGSGQVKRQPNDIQAGGVLLAGASDVSLTGNVFSGLRPQAVSLEAGSPSRGVLAADNVVVDADSDIEKLAAESGSLVTDNLLPADPPGAEQP
jgi:hypothetical protein